jgi:nucleoside-diphosphate-sugar epimerase
MSRPALSLEGGETVGVIGAASYVGQAAVDSLLEHGLAPIGFSRQQRQGGQFPWEVLKAPASRPVPLWIDVGPIWSFNERCERMLDRGARKIVVTSSTSRFTKSVLGNSKEAETARKIERGEEEFSRWCEQNGIAWTILRPTLIYGMGQDKNIREIAGMIRRFGFFPIFGQGSGRRQPIHARDLGEACVAALRSKAADNKAYNVSGAEVLTYRQMVRRVFETLDRRPLTPSIPLPAFRAAVRVLQLLPRFRTWTPEMAQRMNNDMVFDHSEAKADFGFNPRAFAPTKSELV